MKRTTRNYCIILIGILMFAFSNCLYAASKSPAEVVKTAYQLGNQGRYSETEQYLSTAVLKAVENQKILPLKRTWDVYTKNGSLVKIDILNEKIRGEGAEVAFRLHFKDGTNIQKAEPLINEKGKWKITM